MANEIDEMVKPAQVSHVRLGARAQERLSNGLNGTSVSDIMLASGTLSREAFLGEFFKVSNPGATRPKKSKK